ALLIFLFLQDPQQPVDRMVRAVLALAPHLVIENAVLVRLHVLAALEIEGQENGGALAARPTDQMVVVVFLEHGVPLKWRNGCQMGVRRRIDPIRISLPVTYYTLRLRVYIMQK